MTIIIFILILALLVLVHEFGHFITARKSGMRVYEFGFGFPPRAVGIYRQPETKKFKVIWGKGKSSIKEAVSGEETGEENTFPATLYSLNWLPLGGFCKIKGENGEKVAEADSFGFQKWWKKIIVLAAGVTMNFLLAGVLLSLGFMIGLPTDFSGGADPKAIVVEQPKVMVQGVDKKSPADEAGLKFGDVVLKIDNQVIAGSSGMIEYIKNHSQEELTLTIERSGEEIFLKAKPRILNQETSPRLGVTLADAGVIRYPWYVALYKGFVAAFFGLINIFVAFYILFKNLIIGKGMAFAVSGPVGIAVIVGQSVKLGLSYLINITAMLSLSLAAVNILPIPALDGGRIIFILIGKIFRRPVPMKYEQLAHTIGFLLLMFLVVLVTFRDIKGLF